MAKVIFLNSGTAWTVPSDCRSAQVDCIGPGSNGAAGSPWFNGVFGCCGAQPVPGNGGNGGAGGAWARKNSLPLTPGASVSIQVGSSNSGSSTWFSSSGTVCAAAASGSSGGTAASSVGDVKSSGGNGGAGGAAGGNPGPGGGGGGAGGPHGDGTTGGDGALDGGGNPHKGAGGPGDAGNTAANSNGAQYSDGTSTAGPGGGGDGSQTTTGVGPNGSVGGNYGAGGGGGTGAQTDAAVGAVAFGGVAAGGLIVITYTPTSALTANNLTTGAPVLGTPAIGRDSLPAANNFTTGSPALGTPAVGQKHVLSASGLTTGSPSLGTPRVLLNPLFPSGLTTGSPVLGTPALTQIHNLAARDLVTGPPIIPAAVLVELPAPKAPLQIFGDRHVRRGAEDYEDALADLLPTGPAWPREPETVLQMTVKGMARIWGDVDARAADLLEREADPRTTFELLPDWERNWGLPDPCLDAPLTIGDRQKFLVHRITLLGGQSRQFYYDIATEIGDAIKISENSPFMVGISRCGDTRDADGVYRWQIGPPEMRFYWSIHPSFPRLTWFRCGVGQAGVDHHLEIGTATDFDCIFDRWKPAHTQIVFDYSSVRNAGSMAGTP